MPRQIWEVVYLALMAMGPDCKLVHLRRQDAGKSGRIRYIAIQRGDGLPYEEERLADGVRVFVTTPEMLDRDTVIDIIARVHKTVPRDVTLDLHSDLEAVSGESVRGRGAEIPNSAEYPSIARRRRLAQFAMPKGSTEHRSVGDVPHEFRRPRR